MVRRQCGAGELERPLAQRGGHATWYEWTYGDELFGGDFELVARIHGAYEQGDQWRAQYGPVAMPASNELFELFSPNVYDGGAVVAHCAR